MKPETNPNAKPFYSKMNKIHGQVGEQQRQNTQNQLRGILRYAIKQIDGLNQDKRSLTIRAVLGDLLQHQLPPAQQPQPYRHS